MKRKSESNKLGARQRAKRTTAGRRKGPEGLPQINPNAAGIDVGSKQHHVCAPPAADGTANVKVFGTTTPQLPAIVGWLSEHQVTSVAMESTGVYWIPLLELLEAEGLEVILTDTRQRSRVPGRKTDMLDCQWIQLLHSCGLLAGCFRPEDAIGQVRALVRGKAVMVAERSDWIRRMQKALDQMNVRVHQAVSDIDGTTGMAIVRAIVGGERDAWKLAQLPDPRCRKSVAQIAEHLTGNWRDDHLFNLAQALKMYDSLEQHIAEYQGEIMRKVRQLPGKAEEGSAPAVSNKEKAKAFKKRGQEPMRQVLYAMSGADLTAIDGVGVETMEIVLSEYGATLHQFPTEKHFVSHLGLAPRQAISGGKPLHKKRKGGARRTRLGQALRTAATALKHSPSALGAYYRHISRSKGAYVAVLSTARKLATLIFRMLHHGQSYVDQGAALYEASYLKTRINRLQASAKQLGYQLVPQDSAA